jgi:Lrp/AsnC family transcriptional regulator for asnA, asnC and gidA
MPKTNDLDELDLKILSILIRDAKTPYTDIAKQINVSGGTIHVRMKKMEQMGLVKGANLRVDYSKLGYDISAFIGIYLDKSSLYESVIQGLSEVEEVVQAYYTTGLYSIFAKIICRDTNHLRTVLHDKVQSIKGIQRTETFIALEESLVRPLVVEPDVALSNSE